MLNKLFTLIPKVEFSEFVQELASAYFDEMVDHGYEPPPYDGSETVEQGYSRKPCCTLQMMWSAFERIGMVKLDYEGGFEIVKYDSKVEVENEK